MKKSTQNNMASDTEGDLLHDFHFVVEHIQLIWIQPALLNDLDCELLAVLLTNRASHSRKASTDTDAITHIENTKLTYIAAFAGSLRSKLVLNVIVFFDFCFPGPSFKSIHK